MYLAIRNDLKKEFPQQAAKHVVVPVQLVHFPPILIFSKFYVLFVGRYCFLIQFLYSPACIFLTHS